MDKEQGNRVSGLSIVDSDTGTVIADNPPAPAPPVPIPVTDAHQVNRRLERLLTILEQQGAIGGDDMGHVRSTP